MPVARRRAVVAAAAVLFSVVLVPGSAQGNPVGRAEEHLTSCCDPGRCAGSPTLAHSNLGGLGPDAGDQVLRIQGIPAGCDASGQREQVNLEVKVGSSYRTRYPDRNGLTGDFVRINVEAGAGAVCHVKLVTPLGEPVTAEELVLHVFDMDEGPDHTSRTGVSAKESESYELADSTELRKTITRKGGIWFVSTREGLQDDEPTSFDSLSSSQLAKVVSYRYTHVDSVKLVFKETKGSEDHEFIFAVKVCTACGMSGGYGSTSSGGSGSGLGSAGGSSSGYSGGGSSSGYSGSSGGSSGLGYGQSGSAAGGAGATSQAGGYGGGSGGSSGTAAGYAMGSTGSASGSSGGTSQQSGYSQHQSSQSSHSHQSTGYSSLYGFGAHSHFGTHLHSQSQSHASEGYSGVYGQDGGTAAGGYSSGSATSGYSHSSESSSGYSESHHGSSGSSGYSSYGSGYSGSSSSYSGSGGYSQSSHESEVSGQQGSSQTQGQGAASGYSHMHTHESSLGYSQGYETPSHTSGYSQGYGGSSSHSSGYSASHSSGYSQYSEGHTSQYSNHVSSSVVDDGHGPWLAADSQVCQGHEVEWASCDRLPACNHCLAQDCQFAQWGQWYDAGGCTGLCFRHRDEARPNNECGRPCDGLVMETKKCQKRECMPKEPEDGELSPWSEWSTCRDLQRERYRQVMRFPKNGGRPALGPLREVIPCGGEVSQDCVLSAWSVWTTCSATCGAGWHNRMRRILKFSTGSGSPCAGTLRQMRPCSMAQCSGQDCLFGQWSMWQGCNAQYPLQRVRTRVVTRDAQAGGRHCSGPVRETQPCVAPGPSDCRLSPWDDWSPCDRTCGGGQSYRKRRLVSPAHHNGECIDSSLREVMGCNEQSCVEEHDCYVSQWSSWSKCSARCSGIHKRARKIVQRATETGRGCKNVLEQVASCSEAGADCSSATDCQWGGWNAWSACTCSCGGGTKRRNRHIAVAPTGSGRLCAVKDKSEVVPCNDKPCDEQCVDGLWGQWSSWGECSTTCGSGFLWRHRDIVQQANYCGRPAVGRGQDWKLCSTEAAFSGPQAEACGNRDCVLSPWNEWSDCSCTCFGVRERQRVVAQFHSGIGRPCIGLSLKEVHPCNPGPGDQAPEVCRSPKHDCILGQWSMWSACPVTCGGGNHERSRHILHPASNQGRPCSDVLKQTQPCAISPCDAERCVDCLWAPWSEWGACTKCGDQRYRHRGIERLPNHCGRRCEPLSAKEVSNCTSECHKTFFCSLRPWSAWSGCSADCGAATRMRQRSLSMSAERPPQGLLFEMGNYGGSAACSGTQVDSEQCTYRSCVPGCVPQACEFQPWSDWQAPTCTGLCERTRVVSRMNNECGPPCDGSLVQTKRCLHECNKAKDCMFSQWHPWSQPDADGSTGQLFRTRSVVQVAENGGRPCLGALQQTICLHPEILHPCVIGVWGQWSGCSKSCGGGWRERSRSIDRLADVGSKPCDDTLAEGQECSTQSCGDTDCLVGPWGPWSGCSDHGQEYRRREVEQQPTGNGRPCGGLGMGDIAPLPLGETRSCGPIRTDCVVSEWTVWDSCDKTCGGGEQQRHRQVEVYPSNGGRDCPESLHEMRGCSLRPCSNQDCHFGTWSQWGVCSATCGTGQQQRHREILQQVMGPGRPCKGFTSETRQCLIVGGSMLPKCDSDDCQWGDWSDWSGCSCSCSGGQRNRARHIARAPRNGGLMCAPLPKEEVEPCNTQPCHMAQCVNGRWGPWEEWNQCSESCGGGVTWRHRSIQREASECGIPAVGLSRDTRSCNVDVSCEKDVDCQWSSWSEWSGCTRTCDGVKRRSRRISVNGRGNGAWCLGAAKETSPCNPVHGEPPPRGCNGQTAMDCLLGVWGEWSRCMVTCGGGQVRRERSVMQQAVHGGKGCVGPLAETRTCAPQSCPTTEETVDCQWGEWSVWGACSKCGGQRTRFRHVLREPRNGGRPCAAGAAEEMGKCPRQCEEKLYCVWADWGPYSPCSETCGHNGKRSRRRRLELRSYSQLKALGNLFEDQSGIVGLSNSTPFGRFLSQSLNLEILVAFVAGLFGRAVILSASRALERRRLRFPNEDPQQAPASSRENSDHGSRGLRWPGSLPGSWFAADRRGYLPVSQAPFIADAEA